MKRLEERDLKRKVRVGELVPETKEISSIKETAVSVGGGWTERRDVGVTAG